MHALWGLGMLSLSKSIVVVDEHVDVHDYADVFFRVTANVDPKRDMLITDGPLDHLDHAPGSSSTAESSASTRRTSCPRRTRARGPRRSS